MYLDQSPFIHCTAWELYHQSLCVAKDSRPTRLPPALAGFRHLLACSPSCLVNLSTPSVSIQPLRGPCLVSNCDVVFAHFLLDPCGSCLLVVLTSLVLCLLGLGSCAAGLPLLLRASSTVGGRLLRGCLALLRWTRARLLLAGALLVIALGFSLLWIIPTRALAIIRAALVLGLCRRLGGQSSHLGKRVDACFDGAALGNLDLVPFDGSPEMRFDDAAEQLGLMRWAESSKYEILDQRLEHQAITFSPSVQPP